VGRLRTNRFWLILLGVVVTVSAVAALVLRQVPTSHAHIIQDGVLIESINISVVTEPYTINIEGSKGLNVIAVERGRIRMLNADCPDGTCVRQGWVSGGMTPIVCLPNRLLIKLDSGNRLDIDAVVG
jgi:hypothetical protein